MPPPAGDLVGRPHPISQFVLKVHGRCDLACDHCYVFEHADQSWRRKDKMIMPGTVRAAAARIAEHATAWRLPRVHVILHGGEPLLLGEERLRAVLAELRATIEPATQLRVIMQTNGVRLTAGVCDLLVEYGVRVGVSLDGDAAANDLHRRFANGASSHAQVRRALALLRRPAYRSLYGGILCTVDLRNDPIAVYEALAAELPPRIDFLLPHATWETPPPRPGADPAPYATWLAAIHERWRADGRPMDVRLFDALLSTAAGGPSGSEQLGADAADVVVIETDGSWEQADSLKTAYAGAPDTGMSVFTHSVDQVSAHPAVHGRQLGVAGLSATCRACPVVQRCGGGLYAHRYREGTGFDNPSAYCGDLKELIRRVDSVEEVHMAESARTDAEYAEFLDEIAAGRGGAAAIQWLAGTQRAIARALLVAVADTAPRGPARDAWDLLTEIDRDAPAAVDQILAHPYLRVWAVAALKNADPREEVGHLASIAAVAGLRSGVEAELQVRVRGGEIHLPTLGTVRLADVHSGPARVSLGYDGFTVLAGDEKLTVDLTAPPTTRWRPARRITAGELDVLLEDGDPHRDCHRWEVAPALDAAEERAWRRDAALAWQVIGEQSPAQVPGLAVGLRAIVPLRADPAGRMRASTARDAFGAVAAARADHAALAVMLVHEFQHSKLGAVLDLFDLFDAESPVLMRVGWRPDERPIEGALQGTYAHLAVAEIWHHRAAGEGGEAARQTFEQYREWTLAAIDGLRGSGALTPLGEQFVDRMAVATEGWAS